MYYTAIFKKYYARLQKEGWIKAALCGTAAGFGVMFAVSLLVWLLRGKGFWIGILAGVAVTAAATALFYFLRFQPNDERVARRLDKLGLEERIATMVEFSHEEGGIYELQRKDAADTLQRVNKKDVKIVLPVALSIVAWVCFVLGAGMTVVCALSDFGVLPSGGELLENATKETEYCSVTYEVAYTTDGQTFVEDEGGMVESEPVQIVVKGEDAQTVVAVADEGYVFLCWLDKMYDEEQNPERTDKNIQEDVVYMAVFTEPDDSSGDGEGENENQDTDQDKSEPSEGESNSNSQDRNEQNEEQSNQTTQTDPSNSNNDIIDEETYYRDVLESYYESAMQKLAAGGELTAEEQAFIEQYFGIIS